MSFWKKKSLRNVLQEKVASLNRYFSNLKRAKTETLPCERVLADSSKVGDFGYFWKNQAVDIQMVTAIKLMEYEAINNFTKQEVEAFKLGLSVLPTFLQECQIESEMRLQNVLANKQS